MIGLRVLGFRFRLGQWIRFVGNPRQGPLVQATPAYRCRWEVDNVPCDHFCPVCDVAGEFSTAPSCPTYPARGRNCADREQDGDGRFRHAAHMTFMPAGFGDESIHCDRAEPCRRTWSV